MQMNLSRDERRAYAQECLAFEAHLVEQPVDAIADLPGSARPLRAWRSRRHLVVLWKEAAGWERLTCQRTAIRADGEWEDGITWDDLMRLKREAGLGDCWALEVFPADAHVVNVANLRHLWLMHMPPPFAWKAMRP